MKSPKSLMIQGISEATDDAEMDWLSRQEEKESGSLKGHLTALEEEELQEKVLSKYASLFTECPGKTALVQHTITLLAYCGGILQCN